MQDINKKVGAQIKKVRLERKLSREQIARRAGVCQQNIEKYEKGEIEISVRQLSVISNILNVSITYLLLPDKEDQTVFHHFVDKHLDNCK